MSEKEVGILKKGKNYRKTDQAKILIYSGKVAASLFAIFAKREINKK
ncbi:hypothetical protein KKC00_00410 [Patescibacteria group bacterium]|nr:hypothetical protein [Patescibacteria group bacterium]